MITIGIDLGTTFSAVAACIGGERPVVLENSDGETTTPSVIYFPENGNPIVGSEAKVYQAAGEKNIAAFFKRSMGDPAFFLEFNGKRYTAIDLSALLLAKLKADAEAALGEGIEAAVVTVPAYFNNSEREATVCAAQKAGLRVLRIINEPTAAALAYGLSAAPDQCGQITMVYDLGGGTFDVSLVKVEENRLTVLASDGNHRLGGKDWDDRVASFLGNRFKEEFGLDLFADQESFNDLMVLCEKAKKELSARESTRISITHGGEKGTYTLTRAEFGEITRDLLERTQELAQAVLNTQPETRWESLDGVLLVGGSTRMPMVAAFIEETTGRAPLRGINVDEAVALGAALQASIDQRAETAGANGEEFELEGVPSLVDVTAHSLGMVAENDTRSRYINSFIIPKNASIPCVQARAHTLRVDAKNNELDVYMLQGENEDPLGCSILGKYIFSGISRPPNGGRAVIDVTYAYNRNGTVEVSAAQRGSGKALALRVEPVPEDMAWLGRSPRENDPPPPNVAVAIFVDTSGSMSGNPIKEAEKAAAAFASQMDLNRFSISIGLFSDNTKTLLPLSDNKRKINQAIAQISSYSTFNLGYGNDAIPFSDMRQVLKKHVGPRFAIVLTDGCWSHSAKAINQAAELKAEGIEIIAVGFGGADRDFLCKIATCDENALFTDLSRLVDSFSKIAQVLSEGSPTEDEGVDAAAEEGIPAPRKRGFFGNLFG